MTTTDDERLICEMHERHAKYRRDDWCRLRDAIMVELEKITSEQRAQVVEYHAGIDITGRAELRHALYTVTRAAEANARRLALWHQAPWWQRMWWKFVEEARP